MPNPTHKSAAVPFVNQKGERSMKRVKVERYVAGKKPAYANEDDDDEYYTTDDEMESDESGEMQHDTKSSIQHQDASSSRDMTQKPRYEHSGDGDQDSYDKKPSSFHRLSPESGEDSEEDDPRFRALKKIEAAKGAKKLLNVQLTGLSATLADKPDEKPIHVEEAEDEDEEEIRKRHNLARRRRIEEPIAPQIALDEFTDQQLSLKQEEFERSRAKRVETDDILKDLKLTGIKPKEDKKRESQKREQKIMEMIEKAREQAAFQSQLHKKVEEDAKKEQERELLGKTNISANELESVKTDDEDEEIAYEEWKLREIQRVLRDRSERQLELARAR